MILGHKLKKHYHNHIKIQPKIGQNDRFYIVLLGKCGLYGHIRAKWQQTDVKYRVWVSRGKALVAHRIKGAHTIPSTLARYQSLRRVLG